MSLVEQKYNEALDKMTGQQRVERLVSLFETICEMLSLEVTRQYGQLNDSERRKKIAQRLYLSDKVTQDLLERIESH